jgi:hypothetical protein
MCTDNLEPITEVGEVGEVKMEKRAIDEGLLCLGDRRVSVLWAVDMLTALKSIYLS